MAYRDYRQKTLSYYKQYARRCILSSKTGGRGFANCFESGCGDQVVNYLVAKAHDEPNLRAAIDRMGPDVWRSWCYFVEHGTYVGFEWAKP